MRARETRDRMGEDTGVRGRTADRRTPGAAFGGGPRWRTVFLSLVLAPSMACSGDGRIVLVVYSPHGRDLLAHFERRFEEREPGVDVQWVDMGSQEVLDRIRSERANPQADVWWGAPEDMFDRAAGENLLDSYAPSWASALPAERKDPDGRWFGTFLTPEVIAYNDAVLSPEEAPRDWDDVLNPKWRGKVLIRDPLASGTMRTIFGAIMYREYRRTGNPEAGYDWLRRLDAQTKEYVLNPTILYQKLARREGLVTLWDMPDILRLRGSTDFPIDYVLPESGTPVVVDAIAVVRGAPQPDAARRFVEFAGGREAVLDAARFFYRIPARTDLPPDSLPGWLREALPRIRPMEIDRAFVSEHTPGWLRYWDRHIRGRGGE